MKTHNSNNPASTARGARRWLIAGVLALAAGAGGASFASGGLPGHPGHGGHMATDPAAMEAHIDQMVGQLAADASADQKARVAAIAKAALADLRPVHAQLRDAHASAHALLTAPVIDRAALERLRAVQMQRIDFVSRRLLTAAADAAEVLTPEQRVKFAAQLRAHMQ